MIRQEEKTKCVKDARLKLAEKMEMTKYREQLLLEKKKEVSKAQAKLEELRCQH